MHSPFRCCADQHHFVPPREPGQLQASSAWWTARSRVSPRGGRAVELVMIGAVKNRYIAAEIERTKQMLYAA
jgi:hypothetical protein